MWLEAWLFVNCCNWLEHGTTEQSSDEVIVTAARPVFTAWGWYTSWQQPGLCSGRDDDTSGPLSGAVASMQQSILLTTFIARWYGWHRYISDICRKVTVVECQCVGLWFTLTPTHGYSEGMCDYVIDRVLFSAQQLRHIIHLPARDRRTSQCLLTNSVIEYYTECLLSHCNDVVMNLFVPSSCCSSMTNRNHVPLCPHVTL